MQTQIPQSLSYPVPPKFQYYDQNFYNTPLKWPKTSSFPHNQYPTVCPSVLIFIMYNFTFLKIFNW